MRAVDAYRPKAEPYKVTLDRGLQLRIAPDGKRTLLVRYTVKGSNTERQYRLPQEYGDAPGQFKLAAACAEAGRIRALARKGSTGRAEDTRLGPKLRLARQHSSGGTGRRWKAASRLRREQASRQGRPGTEGAHEVGLPRRNRAASGDQERNKTSRGPLHPIAHKPLATLTASDIRATYEAAAGRSLRRAEYAMQILRAVLRWNGVVIPGNPLGRETAGRDRITITTGRAIRLPSRRNSSGPGGAPPRRHRRRSRRTTTDSSC